MNRSWKHLIRDVVALAGLIVGLYPIFFQPSNRQPMLVADSHYKLLSGDVMGAAPLLIVKKNGSVINNDIYVGSFYFFNDGDVPIKRENVLEQIRFQIGDENSEILEAKILKVTREVSNIKVVVDTVDRGYLKLDFDILETDDGFVCQVSYVLGCPCISVHGIIEGVPNIKRQERTVDYSSLLFAAFLLFPIGIFLKYKKYVIETYSLTITLKWYQTIVLGLILGIVTGYVVTDILAQVYGEVSFFGDITEKDRIPHQLRL